MKVISYERLNQLCECLKDARFCESMDLYDGLEFLKGLLPMCEINVPFSDYDPEEKKKVEK